MSFGRTYRWRHTIGVSALCIIFRLIACTLKHHIDAPPLMIPVPLVIVTQAGHVHRLDIPTQAHLISIIGHRVQTPDRFPMSFYIHLPSLKFALIVMGSSLSWLDHIRSYVIHLMWDIL
ncbi:hypothetical protein M405DRAFT_430279 [Rhizopogon salebrosus TDB-379]|nr:hypothetical protein M405DRAFT_430279 [Rhizopogon salebrosus TDB-379]